MRRFCRLVLFCLLATSMRGASGPTTVNNDDSCDVIVTPAATLLLPYFEVDLSNPLGATTLFTVTNITQSPQIAYVTIWTDYSFPVLVFNIFLTGYDTQSINLFDVLSRGRIAPPGTSSDEDVGDRSLDNDANPLLDIESCDRLAVQIRQPLLGDIQTALTSGRIASRCPNDRVGGAHVRAIGYVTIDVVDSCDVVLPTEAGYFGSHILYDNVLTGDYQQVTSAQNFAQGGTMVHIRAIPEGGTSSSAATNFSRTFYGRLQNGGTADRRQPLPSTFVSRWIDGGATGFATSFKIWREGVTGASAACSVSANAAVPIVDVVRFDEQENPYAGAICALCPPEPLATLPTVSRTPSSSYVFPPVSDAEVGGWLYLNLANPETPIASQNWVVVSMEAEGRYSADVDAAALGDGCTPATAKTDEDGELPAIAPAENVVRPTFASGGPATVNNDDSCDIRVTPAATLLLPYFEVDLSNALGETTLFTITNVGRQPQIARVTLWTDLAYPVLAFDVFLTGYDVQAINLYDVLARGRIEGGRSSDVEAGRRSEDNDSNPLLDLNDCQRLAETLPSEVLAEVRRALTSGRTSLCGTAAVGLAHANAVGYATIDVVANCRAMIPTDPGYFANILYDNVLIGDYDQVSSSQNFAQANAMVHIRAIPEGSAPNVGATNFRRTFYSRLQHGGTTDRRQPLPSTWSAHWISGGPTGFDTTFKIWREAVTGEEAACAVSSNSRIVVFDFVRFDEEENPVELPDPCPFFGECDHTVSFPLVSRASVSSLLFPPNPEGAVAGWIYLNLDNLDNLGPPDGGIALQSWVVVSMKAEGRYSVDFDATFLGNGCSPATGYTDEDGDSPAIGPAPNANPHPNSPF